MRSLLGISIRQNKVLLGYLLVTCGGWVLYVLGLLGSFEPLWPLILALLGVVVVVIVILRYRQLRIWPWWMIVSALILFVVGDALRVLYHTAGNITATRSFIPDLVTIPGYLLAAGGILGFSHFRARHQSNVFNSFLDGVMASLTLLGIIWVYVVGPTYARNHSSLLVRLAIVIYPSLSMFMLVVTLRMPFPPGERRPPAFWFITITMISAFVANVIGIFPDLSMVRIPEVVVETPYSIAYIFAGAAALHPTVRSLSHPSGIRRRGSRKAQFFLVSLALATPALLVFGVQNFSIGDSILLFMIDIALAGAATARVVRAFHSAKRSEEELAHIASHDALTGLANRRFVIDALTGLLNISAHHNENVALIFIDLDHFKQVNDTFGHAGGDELLVLVARRIKSIVRHHDLVARLGGDEFIVMLEGVRRVDEAISVATDIRNSLNKDFSIRGRETSISASIGVALTSGAGGDDAEYLLRDADAAMYGAKASGRDKVVVFDSSLQAQKSKENDLKRDLGNALSQNELFIVYQPIVRALGAKVEGIEALLRWQHPTFGLISPVTFVPIAEELGLISEIELWVLDQALEQLWAVEASGIVGDNFYLSVNISDTQLNNSHFAETVFDLLTKYKLRGEMLCLELSEAVLLRSLEGPNSVLESLRALDVKIALDGFEAQDLTLTQFEQLSIDKVKIDNSMFELSNTESGNEVLMIAIMAMVKSLEMAVVVKGIETHEQAARIRQLGCDSIQGYLYSKPVRSELLPECLHRLQMKRPGMAGMLG